MKTKMSLAFISAALAASALTVTDVTARQRWPWNNLVDVDFTLGGTESGAWYQIDIAATYPGMVGDEVGAKTLVSEPVVTGDGTHRITWDLNADCPGLVTTNFSVRVTATPFGDTTPIYMVIDLSSGPNSSNYPVRYTTQAPDLSDDTCRTTEMWLRRCPAGTFTMGYDNYYNVKDPGVRSAWGPHTVTHSWPFYIGIFECTQQQWYQVYGTWPSHYSNTTYRATRPVEKVSFQNHIRGNTGWTDNNPSNGKYCSNGTFIDKMRVRTGFTWLDVPTESQWEYAARAGTDYEYGWAGVTASTIRSHARGANTPSPKDGTTVNVQDGTVTTDYGTAKVGSYSPNNWGLYDMLGNVAEWCGDGYSAGNLTGEGYTFVDPRMDPYAPTHYSGGRVTRGGAINNPNNYLNVYNRVPVGTADSNRMTGFRIVVTVK